MQQIRENNNGAWLKSHDSVQRPRVNMTMAGSPFSGILPSVLNLELLKKGQTMTSGINKLERHF